jgi:hypothetical protein
MITLIKARRVKGLSEMNQTVPFKFAFVTKQHKMCHQWVYCRDFLQDAIRVMLTEKPCEIYGFKYDPVKDRKLDMTTTRMAVSNITKEQAFSALKILHLFEFDAEIYRLSELDLTEEPNTVVFTSASDWMDSPFTISLYTFLIRLGYRDLNFNNKEEFKAECDRIINDRQNNCDNDAEYMRSANKILWKVLPKRSYLSWKEVDYSGYDIHYFHNTSGVVSLAKLIFKEGELKTAAQKHLI